MPTGWTLGIDFGTCFTVAAWCADGSRGEILDLAGDGSLRMPSCVWRGPDGELLTGREAERRALVAPAGFVKAPKRLVGRQEQVLLNGSGATVTSLVGAVLGRVREVAWSFHGGREPTAVRLTCPAAWAGIRRNVVVTAASLAGLGRVELIDEPLAAAYRISATTNVPDGSFLAVYDLGGGTFDVALLRKAGGAPMGGFALQGPPDGLDPLGGDRFDSQLLRLLLGRPPFSAHPDMPSLAEPADERWLRYRRLLEQETRRAKEALSSTRTEVVWAEGLQQQAILTREDVDECIRADVTKSVDRLELVLRRGGLTAQDLAGVFLTGGSSRIPLVPAMVAERLGRVTIEGDPKSVVALGAAQMAGSVRAADPVATSAEPEPIEVPASSTPGWRLTQVARMPHHGAVPQVCFSPDGARLATACSDGWSRVWQSETGRVLARMRHVTGTAGLPAKPAWTVAFSPDGQLVATGGDEWSARLWDSETGRERARCMHAGAVTDLAFAADGAVMASASQDGFARIWEVPTGRELLRLPHAGPVRRVTFSQDGCLLATASEDYSARLWDCATGRELVRIRHGAPVVAVAVSPDGRSAASASLDGSGVLWGLAAGCEVARLRHRGAVLSVCFSAAGDSVATCSTDRTVRIWDASSGAELTRLPHAGPVAAIAITPDGNCVASACSDAAIRLWHVATGQELACHQSGAAATCLTFSTDGARLGYAVARAAVVCTVGR